MNLSDLHFLRPIWLWALLPLALLLWRRLGIRGQRGNWAAACDPQLLPHVLIEGSGGAGRKPIYALGLAGLLVVLALAGPTWKRLPQPVFRSESALVILLDLSASMNAGDLAPSRLERARYKAADILRSRREGQTALVVFAASPFTVSPLTEDGETIASQLGSLETDIMPSQGSRVDLAIEKGLELLQQAGAARGELLLIADSPGDGRSSKSAEKLQSLGHRLSALGVGTEEGAPVQAGEGGFLKDEQGSIVLPRLEEGELKSLARAGGGLYRRLAADDSDLDVLLSSAAPNRLGGEMEETELQTDSWREEGPWLLLPVLLLAPLAFRRGALALIPLLLFGLPTGASALEWEDLWTNPDQKGARSFAAGETERAASEFSDPAWKAAANYRSGKYEQALDSMDSMEDASSHYNRGNALARLGRYEEALQAYDNALELDPQNEDAGYNRELIEEELEEQEGQKGGGDPSDDSDKEQDEKSEDGQEDEEASDGGEDQGSDQEGSEGEEAEREDGGEGSESSQEEKESDEADATEDAQNAQKPESREGGEASDGEEPQPLAADERAEDESRQATEQWLRRIPDDPGGLLRRKFLYQYKNQRQTEEEKPW